MSTPPWKATGCDASSSSTSCALPDSVCPVTVFPDAVTVYRPGKNPLYSMPCSVCVPARAVPSTVRPGLSVTPESSRSTELTWI